MADKEFFRWAGSGVCVDVGFPDAREDQLRDPKRVYWAKLTVRESAAHQDDSINAVIEETLMHWRTAAESIYRGDTQAPHEFYTKRTHTLATPINAPLVIVAGDVRLETGESVYVTLTERGTAAQAISDAHCALTAKRAVYKRLESKLGVDVIASLPAVPPKPWTTSAPQVTQPAAPTVTAPAAPSAPSASAIYVGGKKAPKDYAYVDGQVYIFDIHAVTAKAELDETGNSVYTWSLWGKYGNSYGKYPDFEIDGARNDSAAVMEGLWRLGLNRVISSHQPVNLRYTAKCRIADSKTKPDTKKYYFNPVYIEATAAPPAPAVASY